MRLISLGRSCLESGDDSIQAADERAYAIGQIHRRFDPITRLRKRNQEDAIGQIADCITRPIWLVKAGWASNKPGVTLTTQPI